MAEYLSILIGSEYQKIFLLIGFYMKSLQSIDDVNTAALAYFEQSAAFIDDYIIKPDQFKNKQVIEELEIRKEAFKMLGVTASTTGQRTLFSAVLRSLEINPNSDSVLLGQLKRKMDSIHDLMGELLVCKAKGEFQKIEQTLDVAHAKYESKIAKVHPQSTNLNLAESDINKASFAIVLDLYLKSLKSVRGKKPPTELTLEGYEQRLQLFCDLLQNREFNTITKQDIINCTNYIYNLPKNIKKIPLKLHKKYKTYLDIIKDNTHTFDKVSNSTAAEYFMQFNCLLKFAFENNYTATDLSAHLKYSNSKIVEFPRIPFSTEELTKIFNSYLYNNEKTTFKLQHYNFWLPILGAFTGARLNEICSLKLSDITFDSENTCYLISINDDDEKKVKTQCSIRTVKWTPKSRQKI